MAKIVRRSSPDAKAELTDSEGVTGPMAIPTYDVDMVTRLIRQRRSVFPQQFSGEPVSREDVALLLENAHWAPSHGRTEPWLFKVFSGASLERLGKAHAEMYKTHKAPEDFQERKYEKLIRRPTECAHVIALCMKRGDNPKIPEVEEIEAVAMAVQNLWLTANAMGLAGYWSSGGMTYHQSMHDFMELGPDDKFLGFFMLGRPKDEWPRGKRRVNWQEKVEWIEE
ncbi:MAG: nitroreductase [Bacteroidota bacterium]